MKVYPCLVILNSEEESCMALVLTKQAQNERWMNDEVLKDEGLRMADKGLRMADEELIMVD